MVNFADDKMSYNKNNGHENRAAEDFMDAKYQEASVEKRRFVNMREAMLDVLISLDYESDNLRFVRKLKKRVLESRSIEELRLIMDGILALSNFIPKGNWENENSDYNEDSDEFEG